MPPTNAKRQPDTLAQRFELEETFLSSPNTAALKSAVIRAVDRRTGDPVVLKYWEKTGTAVDADFKELWRHEMRQSERVRAFPRADEVVAEVLASGESDDAFYITMPSDIAPLEYASRFARPDHWLRALHGPRQRVLLWKNLRRLAEALGAVHGQGLVHGRIDGRAVYSAGAATKADFRLGGFEFCLRVAELDKAPLRVIAKSRPVGSVIFSFLDDWRALGRVLADLIGLDADKLNDEEALFIEGRPKIDLRASEIDLVRLLFQPERNRVLDAPTVTRRIDAVLNELDAEALADNSRFILALRLGQTSRLSATLNGSVPGCTIRRPRCGKERPNRCLRISSCRWAKASRPPICSISHTTRPSRSGAWRSMLHSAGATARNSGGSFIVPRDTVPSSFCQISLTSSSGVTSDAGTRRLRR